MRYVLFTCPHGADRSQMARAFFERDAPPDFRAEAAGLDPAPAILPLVVDAMAEVGIDLSEVRPRRPLLETQLHADRAISMGPDDVCPYVLCPAEQWRVPDPACHARDEVRLIRDLIESRVRELVAHRLSLIRADRTVHEMRLARLLPPLVDEFADARAPQAILACADAALARFSEAPVRSHAVNLAYAKTRACLRRDWCELTLPDWTHTTSTQRT